MRPEQFASSRDCGKLASTPMSARWREGLSGSSITFVNGHILELSLNPIVVDGRTTGVSVFGKEHYGAQAGSGKRCREARPAVQNVL